MNLTPLQCEVARFAARSEIRESLACVEFDGKTATATDSFRLVSIEQVGRDSETPVLIRAADLKTFKKGADVTGVDDGLIEIGAGPMTLKSRPCTDAYPQWRDILPKEEPAFSGRFNAAYLAEMFATLAKVDPVQAVTIEFYGAGRPLILKASSLEQNALGLLMPFNR